MRNDFISFETAKLAKERGFSSGVETSYVEYHSDFFYDDDPDHPESHHKGDIHADASLYTRNNVDGIDHSNKNYTMYEAPTQSLLQKWLRDVYNIHIELQYSFKKESSDIEWWFYIYPTVKGGGRVKYFPDEIGEGLSYEEALEAGLNETLKLI